MSYDIYGENLRRGYCEVHPHISEEYPCSLCCLENELYHKRKEEYSMTIDKLRIEYENEMIKQHEQELAYKEIGFPQ